jgi:EAL domain-containing protein (putative c-di-GMP-specific phosphodiesterase class I)
MTLEPATLRWAIFRNFPSTRFKIDRSFVSMSGTGVSNPEIVRTIISLAASLSLETTAEGIETYEQLEELTSLNCTYRQGYLFAKPLNAAGAEALIAAWNHSGSRTAPA